jgi:hypothetical protein
LFLFLLLCSLLGLLPFVLLLTLFLDLPEYIFFLRPLKFFSLLFSQQCVLIWISLCRLLLRILVNELLHNCRIVLENASVLKHLAYFKLRVFFRHQIE